MLGTEELFSVFTSLHLALRPQTQRVWTRSISGKGSTGRRNNRAAEGVLPRQLLQGPFTQAESHKHRHFHCTAWPWNSQHCTWGKRLQGLRERAPKFYSQYFSCNFLALAQLKMYWFNTQRQRPLPPLCTLISFTSVIVQRWERKFSFLFMPN